DVAVRRVEEQRAIGGALHRPRGQVNAASGIADTVDPEAAQRELRAGHPAELLRGEQRSGRRHTDARIADAVPAVVGHAILVADVLHVLARRTHQRVDTVLAVDVQVEHPAELERLIGADHLLRGGWWAADIFGLHELVAEEPIDRTLHLHADFQRLRHFLHAADDDQPVKYLPSLRVRDGDAERAADLDRRGLLDDAVDVLLFDARRIALRDPC